MKPDPLDSWLTAYAQQPVPNAAEPSKAQVWREIERRRSHSVWARIFTMLELREFFVEPRMVVGAVAFAVVVGVVPASVLTRTEHERNLARQSIHLEAFAMNSGALGSVFTKPTSATVRAER